MKSFNLTVENFKESIFSTMTKMANEHNAINLSQGFPDFDGPAFVVDYAKEALMQGHLGKNQYAPSMGILPLRENIAKNYQHFYMLNYNPNTEIIVTNGATEAIFCTIMGLVNPQDEVIVFEPFYDSYLATIEMARGIPVPVTLKRPDFKFDLSELKKAISSKTKLLILNNPHNPTGKVWSREEIAEIAKLAHEFDFYLLSDEVYEFLTFDCEHIPTASLYDLYDRTITISSTGKTFGLTGWKIGWACAPSAIIKMIHNVHQFNVFCVAHPLQIAMSQALANMNEYLVTFKQMYREKRDLLIKGLEELGFSIYKPQGTYFIVSFIESNDVEFCKKLITEKQVATIPTSAFYKKSNEGNSMIRFCFAKKNETLQAALDNLRR